MLPPSSSNALRLAEPRTGATSGGSGLGPADSAGCASTDSAGEDVPGRPAVTAVPGDGEPDDGEPGAAVVDAVVVGSADPAAPSVLPAVGDAAAVPLAAGEPLDDAVADALGVPVARGVGRGVRGDGVGVGGAVDGGGGAVAVGVGGGVAWVTTTAFDTVRLG
jgi:hypothetical protein